MTMKEFKKYLENLIKEYEKKDDLYGTYTNGFAIILKELKDIRKVINT